MKNFLRKLIVTGLGTGYLRPAPGTWGSAAVCVIFLLLLWALGPTSWILPCSMGIVVIIATVGCVALGDFTEKAFGKKDPSYCTLDEWAGQAVVLIYLPLSQAGNWGMHFLAVGVAFVTFRFFDIIKPPPARQAEKLSKGLGVVADDIIAGVYAYITSLLILKFAIGL